MNINAANVANAANRANSGKKQADEVQDMGHKVDMNWQVSVGRSSSLATAMVCFSSFVMALGPSWIGLRAELGWEVGVGAEARSDSVKNESGSDEWRVFGWDREKREGPRRHECVKV